MTGQFVDKTAIVTGASRRIGLAVGERLVAESAPTMSIARPR